MGYDVMTFMATKIALAYATYPFVTMNLNPAFMLYKRVFFVVHIAAALILVVVPRLYPPPAKKSISNAYANTNITNNNVMKELPTPTEPKKEL
ncbi:unnamed protein product [Cylicostephanus goldi]|uniref:Uncharacterized protein n=1 Tax=Cylicostephanus goldi TaxID=71465 RepID=A0A3P6SPT9_CYLGO|nr:unnamed protein product [Cylicostephanus goldi]